MQQCRFFSSLKQTKFSEVQTRHLKLGKISSSTKECQKSSAGRLCSLVLDFHFFCLSNLALRIPIYCYKYLQCWLCNELLFPLEIFRLAKDEKKNCMLMSKSISQTCGF